MSGPEARVEARCCTIMQEVGGYPIKLHGSVAGEPDRAFLMPWPRWVWLVEFKALHGVLSPRQRYVHDILRVHGHPVSVCRTVEQFRDAFAEQVAFWIACGERSGRRHNKRNL